ncbi:hypothetical protein MJM43_29690, partial [Salmonella enterica subsp. enterica serovar Montevideo]|nr:hypothetical protein [Salmonella enterica subsp. enterica serovar Montevideo]
QVPGTFTPWQPLPEPTDVLFYEGLHGGVVTPQHDVARHVDLLRLLAGWMRIPWGRTIFFLCLGKALRYVALAAATVQGMMWW